MITKEGAKESSDIACLGAQRLVVRLERICTLAQVIMYLLWPEPCGQRGPQSLSDVLKTGFARPRCSDMRTDRMRLEADGGDGRDPRMASWWTGCSVTRRLPAHLTEQAGSARISPGGHRRSDLVLERVVVWTRLGVRGTRGRPTRKQRRGVRMQTLHSRS